MRKMEKSFFLIEVLISIVLISGVIFSLFQIKSNSMYFLEKYGNNQELKSAIFLVSLNNKEMVIKDKSVYLNDVVEFKDDDIRRKLKNIKVEVKDELEEIKDISLDGLTIKTQITKINYSVDKEINKQFHIMKFN